MRGNVAHWQSTVCMRLQIESNFGTKKNKVRRIRFPDFQNYSKAIMINCINNEIDAQVNGTECRVQKRTPHKHGQLVLTKVQYNSMDKGFLLINGIRTPTHHIQKKLRNKLCHKSNNTSKSQLEVSHRPEIYVLQEKVFRVKARHTVLRHVRSKILHIKTDKLDIIKITFILQKDTSKMKRQCRDWEKIFVKHIMTNDSRRIKELSKLENINNFKMHNRVEEGLHQRR